MQINPIKNVIKNRCIILILKRFLKLKFTDET